VLSTTLPFAKIASGDMASWTMIASGVADRLHSAAGCAVAESAGAVLTGAAGEPWTLETASLVAAATPELHALLVRLIAESFGS
jgi:myo-inositol-1(or 4)-monophosphatase